MLTARYTHRGEAMVLMILMIGMLNVCLGYALAVHLGYGPPSLMDAWDALGPPGSCGGRTETAGQAEAESDWETGWPPESTEHSGK